MMESTSHASVQGQPAETHAGRRFQGGLDRPPQQRTNRRHWQAAQVLYLYLLIYYKFGGKKVRLAPYVVDMAVCSFTRLVDVLYRIWKDLNSISVNDGRKTSVLCLSPSSKIMNPKDEPWRLHARLAEYISPRIVMKLAGSSGKTKQSPLVLLGPPGVDPMLCIYMYMTYISNLLGKSRHTTSLGTTHRYPAFCLGQDKGERHCVPLTIYCSREKVT